MVQMVGHVGWSYLRSPPHADTRCMMAQSNPFLPFNHVHGPGHPKFVQLGLNKVTRLAVSTAINKFLQIKIKKGYQLGPLQFILF